MRSPRPNRILSRVCRQKVGECPSKLQVFVGTKFIMHLGPTPRLFMDNLPLFQWHDVIFIVTWIVLVQPQNKQQTLKFHNRTIQNLKSGDWNQITTCAQSAQRLKRRTVHGELSKLCTSQDIIPPLLRGRLPEKRSSFPNVSTQLFPEPTLKQ